MRKEVHPSKIRYMFQMFAERIAVLVGSPMAFFVALLIIVIWAILGPLFDYSEKWHLFINSSTTIVTLLMVFLIQNTQNRELNSIQLKLDALLKKAGLINAIIDIEDLPDEEREMLKKEFKDLYLKYVKKREEAKTRRENRRHLLDRRKDRRV